MTCLAFFQAKHVPGLYSFNHFEDAEGAFIQVHVRGDLVVYQAADGTRKEYRSIKELKKDQGW
jgi:hypothetical protein